VSKYLVCLFVCLYYLRSFLIIPHSIRFITVTDTAAMPEPTTTPVKKRTSRVRKRTSSPAKKSTRKGHVRKVFTPAGQTKESRRRLHPDKGPRARANRGESRGCTRSRFSSHGKSSKKRRRSRNRNKYGGRKSQGPGVTLPLPCHYPTKRDCMIDYGRCGDNDTAVASLGKFLCLFFRIDAINYN